jgi:protein-tyrosine-phosphatase
MYKLHGVHVLFVCLHNAGRSQMSETLFDREAEARSEVSGSAARGVE